MFLDSDDILTTNALETAFQVLHENHADMVQWCAHDFVTTENPYETGTCEPVEHRKILTDSKGALEILLDNKGRSAEFELLWNGCRCVWTKLCRAEIFKEIRFPAGKEYEDDYIVHKCFLASQKIVFINDKLTNYRKHSQSTLHKMGLKGRLDKLECEYERFLCMLELGVARLIFLAYHNYFISLLNTYLQCERLGAMSKGKELVVRAKQDVKKYGEYMSGIDKAAVKVFYMFPGLFAYIYMDCTEK